MNIHLIWILLTVLLPISSSSDLSEILQLCLDGSCVMTPEEQEYIKSSSYSDALKKYLNSGVSQFMWDYIMDSKLTQEISLPCRDHLLSVAEGVKKGIHPDFMKIVAASGKLPYKFFAGTITSLGDYDTCLSL